MYSKIFTKILDSSIWLESNPTRIVWLTFLAAMDETGFAQFASAANVAHRARVSLPEAEDAIKCLESVDHNSSDPENEGRRIERIPGGWIVLNAIKYRDIVTRATAQEKTRLRVAAFRAKKKTEAGNAPVTVGQKTLRSVTPSEAYTEAEAKGVIPPMPTSVAPLLAMEVEKAEPKPKPLTATQAALNRLFRRRESTRWSKKELASLAAIEPIHDEDLKQIVTYYSAKLPRDRDYRRRDLGTLLANWHGELDRSRNHKPATVW